MFLIKPMIFTGGEDYINVRGNQLKTIFSILESNGIYYVTSSKGNSELVGFLNNLSYLKNKTLKTDGYFWWDLGSSKVITVPNSVMRKLG